MAQIFFYFYVSVTFAVMIKHHGQGNLWKEELTGHPRGIRILYGEETWLLADMAARTGS